MSAIRPDAQLLRDIVETAPDAVVVVDAEGAVVFVNARAEAMFGHDRCDLVGQPVEVLLPERFRAAHSRRRAEILDDPVPRSMGTGPELLAVRRDGREFPVDVSISVLESEQGRLISAAVRDVSERREMLAAGDRMRDELVATVSHELRTPLTAIIGYAELIGDLGDEALSASARRLVEIIQRNAERELRLVNDLLTLAWLDEDDLVAATVPVDLAEVVVSVLAEAGPRARAAGIELVYEDQETALVLGDHHRLTQVVENLVSNAVKFTPAGGWVAVRLRGSGRMTVLEVEDTGMGVADHERELLFERLYRGPIAVEQQIQGAGLGLAIVRAVVEAHGGSVDVESRLGVGSTFRVALPAAVAQPVRAPQVRRGS